MTSLSDILQTLNNCFDEAQMDVEPLNDEKDILPNQHALFEILLGRTGGKSDCEKLAETFKKKLLAERKNTGQSKLNRIRKYLGMWYSTMLLADVCAYDHKEKNLDQRIEQRMQALLVEAMAWLEEPKFCQVLIQTKGLNYRDDTESNSEVVWQCSSGTNADELANFEVKVSAYAKEHGSTIQDNVHSRLRHEYVNLPPADSNFENVPTNPRSDNIFVGKKTSLELKARDNDVPLSVTTGQFPAVTPSAKEEAEFVKFMGKTLLPVDPGILHMASGVDAVFSENRIVSTIAHIYMLMKPGQTIYSRFEELFEIILYRLAHFYSTQLQVQETTRLRRHASMLSALQSPLHSITSALRTVQMQTQELRAILNEPIEAIFAAQNEIADHFQPGKVFKMPMSEGVIHVKVEHKPDMYPKDGQECAWVMSSALSKIRGTPLAQAKDGLSALTQEIEQWKTIQNLRSGPYYHLAHSLARLLALEYNDFNSFKVDKTSVRGHMEVLKERLFTPFKPDHSLDAFQWSLVHAILPIGIRVSHIDKATICIPTHINPMRTQGHLLAFISAFFSTISNPFEPVKIEPQIADNYGTIFVAPIEYAWVHNPEKLQREIQREANLALKRAVSLEENWGDLSAPFIKLVRRIPEELLRAEEKINHGFNFGKFSCHLFCDTGFALTIDTLKICCHRNQFFIGSKDFHENSLVRSSSNTR